ncbi:MAG TPA: 2-amino-4-hydroxy-6-hydroxymethyldihydropteridine diphosphokinase [Gemmatimonadales bacterium]|jgi:2-amino-4-hydroxy-6-hydroxymethyldihydropteridine diphosphokinase|nr:2-amino-4-hydroxy-6-hydroxymethyldihydropteridine diphosphokinase [Gemmatimonadales bacterium]
MHQAFIALGSNLGDREAYLAFGREWLGALRSTRLVAASRIEETAPLGGRRQPRYLNQMVQLRTRLSPQELLASCQRIERAAGRLREVTGRWESRTLDLDIVRYDDLTLDEPGLTLPHPGLPERDFWQRELAELLAHDD